MRGRAERTYIIAEAGVNHNGSLEIAKQLIDVAVDAEVDAVKFQMFTADSLVIQTAEQAEYQQKATKNQSQYAMLKKLELTEEAILTLLSYCQERKIDFLATPFDCYSLAFLSQKCGLKKMKLSSGDLTNSPFLLQAAKTSLPIILSTGMGTIGEIERALQVFSYGYMHEEEDVAHFSWDKAIEAYVSLKGQQLLREKVTLLHCTTEYPAPLEEVNLLAMETMEKTFSLPVGYSDHTEGIAIAIAAAALGAVVIEKHFTLDKTWPGPDHKASLEPDELRQMSRAIRQVEAALGGAVKIPGKREMINRTAARKSLIAAGPICKGEKFKKENLTVKRPGNGVTPSEYWYYLGRRAEKDYMKDDLI